MTIDLNNPTDFTIESLKALIASENDSVKIQVRVTRRGILFLSKDVGNENLDDILFRLETFGAGNDYVGLAASQDDFWVKRLYTIISENWPKPSFAYIDTF